LYNLSHLLFRPIYIPIISKHWIHDRTNIFFSSFQKADDMGFIFYISFITSCIYDDVRTTISLKVTSNHLLIKNFCCLIIYIVSISRRVTLSHTLRSRWSLKSELWATNTNMNIRKYACNVIVVQIPLLCLFQRMISHSKSEYTRVFISRFVTEAFLTLQQLFVYIYENDL